MTLHFHWLHAPRWLPHGHVNRAMTLVLGVIGVSLLFSALRVVDAAVSGALVERRAAVMAPTAAGALARPEFVMGTEPPAASAPIDAVEVPDATAEAISL
jgi:hypothetical protein